MTDNKNDDSSKNPTQEIVKAVNDLTKGINNLATQIKNESIQPVKKSPPAEYRQDSQDFPEEKPRNIKDNSINFPSRPPLEKKSQSESLRVSLEEILKK